MKCYLVVWKPVPFRSNVRNRPAVFLTWHKDLTELQAKDAGLTCGLTQDCTSPKEPAVTELLFWACSLCLSRGSVPQLRSIDPQLPRGVPLCILESGTEIALISFFDTCLLAQQRRSFQ